MDVRGTMTGRISTDGEAVTQMPRENKSQKFNRTTVYEKNGGWYWVDEAWDYEYGPYDTYDGAKAAQMDYIIEEGLM